MAPTNFAGSDSEQANGSALAGLLSKSVDSYFKFQLSWVELMPCHTDSLRSWAYTSKKIVVLVYGAKSDFEIEKIDTLAAWI